MIYNIRHAHRSDHGDLKEKKRVKKFFDPPLSKIGEIQSFKIGERIISQSGRDKKYMFIISPYQRCLKTAEWILSGMHKSWTKIEKNTFFVEDSLGESQTISNVGNLENFKKIEFFSEKTIIDLKIEYNSLDFLKKYRNFEKIDFPENWQTLKNRINYVLKSVHDHFKDKKDVIPIIISHGFFTESLHEDKFGKMPIVYNYGSVNRFEFCEETKKWNLIELDGKYH